MTRDDGPRLPTRTRATLCLACATPLLLGLPLAGIALAGHSPAPYFEFPPLTQYVEHAGFSWIAFALMAAFCVACVAPFLRVVCHAGTAAQAAPEPGRFPAWGWVGLALVAAGWFAAWTRLPALSLLQVFTFLPLWFGYIVTMNALVAWRTGVCPLTHDTRRYLALFPASAAFWWFFEYLNRFVQNWYYVGIDHFGPLEYMLWDSLAFATVLPAVAATQALVASWPRASRGLDNGPGITVRQPRRAACAGLIASSLGLAAIGLWPDFTYPLLWLAPLGVLISLQSLYGLPHVLSPLARGDWRGVWTWALAALLCGVFWETWNYYSAAKWVYAVPFVHRFEIFEMPLLGYAGYLPFGLECAVAADLVRQGLGRAPASA